MKRQTVIILIEKDKAPECWGNLKKLCRAKSLKYNSISKMKLPIEYDGCTIHRVPFH